MSRITVVITTYNRAQFLERAIQSAFQAGSDVEVVVVDDCSTDNTPDLCSKLANIRYVKLTANHGLAHARNIGVAESSSEFITFLDDDDLRLPGSLDKQVSTMLTHDDIALCYGQTLIGDARRQLPTGEIYPSECPQGDIFWELLENNFIPMPSVLARKSALLATGGFNTDLPLIEDWDLWLRISERFLVAAVEEPVAIYRKATGDSAQMCSDSSALCKQALRVQQMALARTRAQTAARAKRRHVKSKLRARAYEILMTEATNLIHNGNRESARARLLDAFHFRPFRALMSGRLPWLLIK
ncbi:MAG TPA: glycosyltransferase [Pyrinomonadaceae bacterium]|nr:glycosyltransferase [Pyrinomonadaceae bacterium]